jgi:hypothetical protein
MPPAPYKCLRVATLAAIVLIATWSAPALALHRSFPGVVRLSSGPPHRVPSGRSWGFYETFASDADLLQTGTTGRQIYLFRMFDYACQRGILRPDILRPNEPCPDPPEPFLLQITNGPGTPDNPSVDDPGVGKPGQIIAFDAGGVYGAAKGLEAIHRQIFTTDYAAGKVTQVTHGTDGDSTLPSVSIGAGAIAFESTASLLGGPAGVSQVFVNFTKTSNGLPQNVFIQVTNGLAPSHNATFNKNGSMITFESTADLLGDGHDTGITQVFIAKLDRQKNTATIVQITGGNAPSQHPWFAEREAPGGFFQSGVWFDSTATNLPGTVGEPGSHIFQADVNIGSLPSVTQKTFTNPMGDCTFPSLDQFATTVSFICTGDPFQNGTTGNRVFAAQQNDSGVVTLFQLTGRGDVVGPISASPGHNFVMIADTTDLTGIGSCSYQLELIDFFDDNVNDNIFQHWASATHPGQLPQDVVPPPTVSGPPPPTNNLLGNHVMRLDPGSTTSGSQLALTTSLGTFPLEPIAGKGQFLMDFSPTDFKGQSIIKIPSSGIVFPPLPVPGLGVVCVQGGATDGDGLLDCDGGAAGGDFNITRTHNTNDSCTTGCREDAPCHGQLPAPHPGVCNGPTLREPSGTFGPGDAVLRLPLSVSLQVTPGLDGSFCGPHDDYVIANYPVNLLVTTKHVDSTLTNADNVNGVTLSASATGAFLDCTKAAIGDFSGAQFVGTIPFLDLPTPFPAPFDHLDGLVTLRLVGSGDTCLDCICIPGPCTSDAQCDNNNVCDGTDACQNATCIPGATLDCDDLNPCTADSCDPTAGCQHVALTGPCDDGSACTTGDTCTGGVCVGTPITCNDNNPCTLDNCDPTLGCVFPDRCDDGNVCNGVEACDITTNTCFQAVAALNCDDLNPCTDDVCDPVRGCLHTNNTNACDDGSLCTFNDTCTNGACVGVPVQCSDGDACNGLETCDSATGACIPGGLPNCNDLNPCTDDTCDPAVGCLHLNNTLPCDDNSVCTTGDVCSNGVCQGTLVINCDDGNPCNGTETCNPVDGTCLPGTAPTCDDGNICTDDSCTPFVGCAHTPNSAPCDDGKRCTFNDTCSGGSCTGTPVPCENGNVCDGVATCDSATGACVAGAIPNCDDGNPCTDDTCDPASGCLHQNNTGACDDNSKCTLFDQCDGNGHCVGVAVQCSDGNLCNGEELCDPATGACLPGVPPNCNDNDVCTFDTCIPATGCQSTPVSNYLGCSANQLDQVFLALYQAVLGVPNGTFDLERHRDTVLGMLTKIRHKLAPIIAGTGQAQTRRALRAVMKKTQALYTKVLNFERSGALQPTFADAVRAQLNNVINQTGRLLSAMTK